MTSKRYSILFLLVTGLVIGAIYFSGKVITFLDVIDADDYLASLTESETFGSRHSTRFDPDVLVIGDSHAFTAINFNMLADGLGTKKVAACTMGGFYPETILLALRNYEALGKLPKTVIYTTSARQFWDDEVKTKQMSQHRTHILASGDGDMITSIQNLYGYLFGVRFNRNAYEELAHKELVHGPLIEAMDEQRVTDVLNGSDSKVLSSFKSWVNSARYITNSADLIDQLCEIVRRNDIDLYVVALPESPWFEQQYPVQTKAQYLAIIDRLKGCAQSVFVYTTQDVGLGNRHFVNRRLRSGYDYSRWSNPDFELTSADFDVDHMNRVGASHFTPIMVKAIAERMGERGALGNK